MSRFLRFLFGLILVAQFEFLSDAAKVAADTPLRIVTLNVEIFHAPGVRVGQLQKYRWDVARNKQFESVASIIEALNPDIFNLVEVTSREGVELLVKILHEKGLTDYRGYHIDSNDTFSGMDVGLISKIAPDPVEGKLIRTLYSPKDDPTWRESYSFTGRSGNPMRLSASLSRNSCYLLTIDGYKLGFLGLHLKSNPSDPWSNARRSAQSKVVQRAIRQELVGRGYLPIVLGDLNDYDPDVPDRDEERDPVTTVLRDIKDFDPEQPGPELVNVAERIQRQADRYTSFWDRNENRVPDPYDVFTMIDHILLPKELMPHVTRVFIFQNIGPETSDHKAVVVDLLLPTLP